MSRREQLLASMISSLAELVAMDAGERAEAAENFAENPGFQNTDAQDVVSKTTGVMESMVLKGLARRVEINGG